MTNKYHQKNKEKLRKQKRESYQNLSSKKKTEASYYRERNRNLSEEQKQKLGKYGRNYYLA